MTTQDIHIKLLMAKVITLRAAGLTERKSLDIQEYEFTVEDGEVTTLEVWSNSTRTKGYKTYKVPGVVKNIFKDIIG